MKNHAIIPVFLPHEGCPNDCVFCNQKKITARTQPLAKEAVCRMADDYLATIAQKGVQNVELAFYGGSFTGMPAEKQKEYLAIAQQYKQAGRISKIRLSTRPDYIDEEILQRLKAYEVDIIELGVQSMDDEVLRLSQRGHDSEAVYRSARLIKSSGFVLGIQLMTGLPGDSPAKSIDSAKAAVKLAPELARIYPAMVLAGTALADWYRQGRYKPWSQEETLACVKEMYRLLCGAGINVIRVGLKSTDHICETGDIIGGGYHPAFRQLVEGALARESLQEQLEDAHRQALTAPQGQASAPERLTLYAYSSARSFSNMIGHKGVNKKYFHTCYPDGQILYGIDRTLPDGCYEIRRKGEGCAQ